MGLAVGKRNELREFERTVPASLDCYNFPIKLFARQIQNAVALALAHFSFSLSSAQKKNWIYTAKRLNYGHADHA
jgi:hypothetical protein